MENSVVVPMVMFAQEDWEAGKVMLGKACVDMGIVPDPLGGAVGPELSPGLRGRSVRLKVAGEVPVPVG